MSKDDLARFMADLKVDAALQADVKTRGGAVAALVGIAKARGYDVTAEEVEAHVRAGRASLTEEELNAVAGGAKSKPAPGIGGFSFSY